MKHYMIYEKVMASLEEADLISARDKNVPTEFSTEVIRLWLKQYCETPVQLCVQPKGEPDPCLKEIIEAVTEIRREAEELMPGCKFAEVLDIAVKYLYQLRMLKGQYVENFYEEGDNDKYKRLRHES